MLNNTTIALSADQIERYANIASKTDIIDTKVNALSSFCDKAFSNLEKISTSLTTVVTHVSLLNKEIESLKYRIETLEREISNYNHHFITIQNDSNNLKERINVLEKKEYDRDKRESKVEGSYETIKKIPKILYYLCCGIFGILSILFTYEQFKAADKDITPEIHRSLG